VDQDIEGEGALMSQRPSGWAIGWTMFAGVLMITIGIWHAMAGLAGVVEDQFYTVTPNYIFKFDATTWGWIHLIFGIVVFLAGLSLFKGAIWARTVGVILGVISAVVGFAWLPWYPIWGILIVVIAVSVIWALTVHGRDADLTHGDDVARY
jgi:tetrahydromethanopterin S-methyltransferase subunit F